MRATPETLEWIKSYYGLMDEGRLADCERFFTDTSTVQIAANPPMVGWETIFTVMTAGLSVAKSIRHEVLNAWEEDDVVIIDVIAHYTLADDRTVDVPGVVIAEVAEGRYVSQRIGVDLSPVYGGR